MLVYAEIGCNNSSASLFYRRTYQTVQVMILPLIAGSIKSAL